MVFDSHYDEYRGAITYVRVMNGTVARGRRFASSSRHDARSARAGPVHAGTQSVRETRRPAQVGYLICNIKSLDRRPHRRHGDACPATTPPQPLPGYREPKRMVYCGLYPSDGQDFEELRDALDQALDQRSQLRVRARNQRRPGLRLPLRLPGPAAHGDRPAAAGAGSRPRPGANRAERDVRNSHHATARRSKSTIRRKCPTRARSRNSASRSCG